MKKAAAPDRGGGLFLSIDRPVIYSVGGVEGVASAGAAAWAASC